MAVILKIGDYNQMAKVPKSFPTCYDYKMNEIMHETSDDNSASNRDQTNSLNVSIFVIIFQLLRIAVL